MKALLTVLFTLVLLVPATVLAVSSYEILDNRFYNQPITCIYEPNVPNARKVIVDAWVRETALGVKNWQYELEQTEHRKTDKWTIETQIVSLKEQPNFDNQDCDVEIRFEATASKGNYAGVHWFEKGKSQILIVYTDREVCKRWSDDIYRYLEWCYKEDYSRSKAIGNIATHEFGHALGLEHYKSDNPYENRKWSLDPHSSPSVMTVAVHYDEDKNRIRQLDRNKVLEIYSSEGFGEPKEKSSQKIPTPKPKNLGGFESFAVSSPEFFNKSGKIQFVTMSGTITESAFATRQKAIVTVTHPDGHEEEIESMVLESRQFAAQMMLDQNTPIGKYSIQAKFRNYDSPTLEFNVFNALGKHAPGQEYTVPDPKQDQSVPDPKQDQSVPNSEPTDDIKIPEWVRNNIKSWSKETSNNKSFTQEMKFLISKGLINIPVIQNEVDSSNSVPLWVKTYAEWWTDGIVTDSEFIQGIQYLVSNRVIQVN